MEEFATAYLIQSPANLWLGVHGLTCIGGLIGSVMGFRATSPLNRIPYFFWSSLFVLGISLAQYWAVGGPEAIVTGHAGPLAVKLMVATVVGGFGLGLLSAARSRDAFGHVKAAPLAFVPLANLWLLLAPSRPEAEGVASVGGRPQVVGVGLLLLAASAFLGSNLAHETALVLGKTDGVPPAISVQYLVNVEGLEGGVAFIANMAHPPYELSDNLTLSSVEASGTEIRATYTFKASAPLSEAFWDAVRNEVCTNELMVPLIKAGATVREIYADSSGRKAGELPVTRRDCHLSPEIGAWSRLAGLIGGWPQGMTLEYRAIGFSLQADRQIWIASLCLAVIGGLFSAIFAVRGATARIGRAAYFLGNCALILVAAASKALLMPMRGVVLGGHVAPMVALWALVQAGCGFALWRLAAARSRSAHGHGKAAALAFIPLANVWLIVAPEREEAEVVERSRPALVLASVLAGLALLGVAHMAIREIGTRTMWSLAVNEDFPPELRVQHFLNRLGLEETIKAVTSEPPVPDGDKLVPQLAHEARGMEIFRTFLVTPRVIEEMKRGNPILDDFFPKMARHEVCEGRTFIPLLKAGATIVNSYGDGARELVGVTLTARECGL
ncbi:MAG: hypothetical protein H6R00_531 [Proteobacteria bacterium]|nr:hypothetical protein [Pseudomonadota bacterium]